MSVLVILGSCLTVATVGQLSRILSNLARCLGKREGFLNPSFICSRRGYTLNFSTFLRPLFEDLRFTSSMDSATNDTKLENDGGKTATVSTIEITPSNPSNPSNEAVPTLLGGGTAGRKPRWVRLRQALRDPFSEFLGVFTLIMFGDGVVAQVVLSKGQKGDYQSINWGYLTPTSPHNLTL